MLDNSKRKTLDSIMDSKPVSWLRGEIVRLCDSCPEAFEIIVSDAIGFSGSDVTLTDALIVEIWGKAEEIISEANEYGGIGNHDEEDGYFYLQEAEKHADKASEEMRRTLIDRAMVQYNYGNSGFEDRLMEFCETLCKTEEDWRYLIVKLEENSSDWNNYRILRILEKIGDDEAFLAARTRNLETGSDYLDLVNHYRKKRNRSMARKYANEGLELGSWHIGGLVDYLIGSYSAKNEAAELSRVMGVCESRESYRFEAASGIFRRFRKEKDYDNGKIYLRKMIDFAGGTQLDGLYGLAADFLTESDFRETEVYLLPKLKRGNMKEYLHACIKRGDYAEALNTMIQSSAPSIHWYSERSYMSAAEQLEKHFPEDIIEYYFRFTDYLIGAGAGKGRENYKSAVGYLKHARKVYLNVLKDRNRWENKLREIRVTHQKRRALIEELRSLG